MVLLSQLVLHTAMMTKGMFKFTDSMELDGYKVDRKL